MSTGDGLCTHGVYVTTRFAVPVVVSPDYGLQPRISTDRSRVTYSLPGAVFLTFPVLPNVEERHPRLLHDVSVVVEGKAEYWDDFGKFESSWCSRTGL